MAQERKVLTLNKAGKSNNSPVNVSFKQYQGIPYNKYLIFRTNTEGCPKKIGKMLAPNDRLALAKAKYNFREYIDKGCEITVQRRV